jgi:hypothetical protein
MELVTIVEVESDKHYVLWARVCSLSYPACNAHVPCYIVICGLYDSKILFCPQGHPATAYVWTIILGVTSRGGGGTNLRNTDLGESE